MLEKRRSKYWDVRLKFETALCYYTFYIYVVVNQLCWVFKILDFFFLPDEIKTELEKQR